MVDSTKPTRGPVTNPPRAVPLKTAGPGKCDVSSLVVFLFVYSSKGQKFKSVRNDRERATASHSIGE